MFAADVAPNLVRTYRCVIERCSHALTPLEGDWRDTRAGRYCQRRLPARQCDASITVKQTPHFRFTALIPGSSARNASGCTAASQVCPWGPIVIWAGALRALQPDQAQAAHPPAALDNRPIQTELEPYNRKCR